MLNIFQWSVVGAGPAGMASVGLLIDNGVNPADILWVDPDFSVGDFGNKWSDVSSNTSVALFLRFLNDIKAFDFAKKRQKFKIESYDKDGFTKLKDVTKPLQFATANIMDKVATVHDHINNASIVNGSWELIGKYEKYHAKKVILATGSTAISLNLHNEKNTQEIDLDIALSPTKLKLFLKIDDKVAVFGSSHSAMIIVRSLVECGVSNICNFYREPLKYAIKMNGWTLYDNTGLKGETAKWVRNNISQNLDSRINRFLSTSENISNNIDEYDKVIYATGFKQRTPIIQDINLSRYDPSNGIIAPGLFGCGICFPRQVIDPNGNKDLNVGLFKFMKDIQSSLPLWMKYEI